MHADPLLFILLHIKLLKQQQQQQYIIVNTLQIYFIYLLYNAYKKIHSILYNNCLFYLYFKIYYKTILPTLI